MAVARIMEQVTVRVLGRGPEHLEGELGDAVAEAGEADDRPEREADREHGLAVRLQHGAHDGAGRGGHGHAHDQHDDTEHHPELRENQEGNSHAAFGTETEPATVSVANIFTKTENFSQRKST